MSTEVFRVESPGLLTTVQDLGRAYHRSSGVPLGGAMDRFALSAANLLVGNPEGSGALECTLLGPRLQATRDCLVAVTGADLGLEVNGSAVPTWTAIELRAGDQLRFAGRRNGARSYLAVGGGIAGDRWLGSVATYVLVGKGGLGGRPLRTGDSLGLASEALPAGAAGRSLPVSARPAYERAPVLAMVPGPHDRRLTRESRQALLRSPFELTADSDRMGFRLAGPRLEAKIEELLSFGITPGCVQVAGSGQPILLMADHQASGGYPVAGCVIRAHLPLAAQLAPGDALSFTEIKVDRGQEEWRRLRAGLDSLRN